MWRLQEQMKEKKKLLQEFFKCQNSSEYSSLPQISVYVWASIYEK